VQAAHKDSVPHRARDDEFLQRSGLAAAIGMGRAPRESMKRVSSRALRRRRRPGRRGQAFIERAERDQSVVPVRCTHIHIAHEHDS
jgi:hypothetical protein